MLVVETIGRIGRQHFVKSKTIREIVRDLQISGNTVLKALRSGETASDHQREVQTRPKLGRWTEDLERLLTSNAEKPSREWLTLIRIFETLRNLGYEGGYDAMRRYATTSRRAHSAMTAAAFMPPHTCQHQLAWSGFGSRRSSCIFTSIIR